MLGYAIVDRTSRQVRHLTSKRRLQDNKIVAYKKSHLELRNLAAEVCQSSPPWPQRVLTLPCVGDCAQLCSKLKRDAAKKEKAEKRVAQLTKQLSAMKARATKAEVRSCYMTAVSACVIVHSRMLLRRTFAARTTTLASTK